MPTSSVNFTSLGRGNYFPFCPECHDVSMMENVNPLTLKQAMKMQYLASRINVDCSGYISGSQTTGMDVSMSYTGVDLTRSKNYYNNEEEDEDFEPEQEIVEPYARSCKGRIPYYLNKKVVNAGVWDQGRIYINLGAEEISKFYDGDVNNESNFIGYGYRGAPPADLEPSDWTDGIDRRFFRAIVVVGTGFLNRATFEIASFMSPTKRDNSDTYADQAGSVTLSVGGENITFSYRGYLTGPRVGTNPDYQTNTNFNITSSGATVDTTQVSPSGSVSSGCSISVGDIDTWTIS